MKAGHWIIMAGLAAVLAGGILWTLREDAPPRRKSGLWEMTNQTTTGGPTVTQICIDQATDDLIHGVGASRMECTQTEWKREGDQIVVRTVCKIDQSEATANSVLIGDFETVYHNEVFVVFDPPMRGNDQLNMSQDARWIGPCPDDMKPGDIVMPDGSIKTAEEGNTPAEAEEPPPEVPTEEAASPEP
jgi:Protein of unknown function (DUF3617)